MIRGRWLYLGLQDANSSAVAYNGKAEPEKKGAVLNLFDMIGPGNFLSLNDRKGAVLRLFTMMGGMMDVKMTQEQLLAINAQLNMIPKPEK